MNDEEPDLESMLQQSDNEKEAEKAAKDKLYKMIIAALAESIRKSCPKKEEQKFKLAFIMGQTVASEFFHMVQSGVVIEEDLVHTVYKAVLQAIDTCDVLEEKHKALTVNLTFGWRPNEASHN